MSRRAAVLFCLVLCACGFQLRGEVPTGLESLYVSTAAPSYVAIDIRRRLAAGPTKLAPSPQAAKVHLRILSESLEKTIQTLTSAGIVFDYQLRLRVGFQTTDAAENSLIEPAEIEVRRVISYSPTAPLAKEAEEKLLVNDMRAEAAARILRRIALVQAKAPRP